MNGQGIAQIVVYAVVLIVLGYPLGVYMARVYTAERLPARRARARVPAAGRSKRARAGLEGLRRCRCSSSASPSSPLLYVLQRVQGHLFLNPDELADVPSHISLNTAASFVTNTNWQFYGGEYTMSYLTQMAGLAVQNFVSAGVGMAVLAAVVRGIARRSTRGDRQLLAGPLPLLRLHPAAARGRPRGDPRSPRASSRPSTGTRRRRRSRARSRRSRAAPRRRRSRSSSSGRTAAGSTTRTPPCPFENPNGLTNFLEMLAILLIPAAPGLHVREDGRGATPRVDGLHRDVRGLRGRRRRSTCPPSSTARRFSASSGVEPHPGQRPVRREHVRQGGPVRHRRHRALGDGDDERLERLGQRRATTR